jgi:hypothetical protein
LAELEGNLGEELQRLALLRSQGKLPLLGGVRRGVGQYRNASIREKIDAFRSAIMTSTEKECWEWKGRTDLTGYGVLAIRQKHLLAHRFSFAVFNRREPEKFICHHCDNPKCVNPDHLFEGTQTDNMHDCSLKGRFGDRKGERNACRKLSNVAVQEIRITSGWRELAEKYGVSKSAIYQARNGQTWAHVPR